MDFLKIAIAAFSATNLMTTFSYIMSNHYNKLFKEPVVLNYLLKSMGLCLPGKYANFSGWLAHYIIGLAFVISYEAIWRYTDVDFGWVSGIMFGIASGFIGIIFWHIMYRLPDKKPVVPLNQYYLQLFFGHVIFAVAVVIAFTLYAYDPVLKMQNAIQNY